MASQRSSIVLGGGCFWCTEAVFSRLKGVRRVTPGYAGGHTTDPTYNDVCSGKTGHAEVVQVVFDDQIIALTDLLDVFFATHDPTTPNRQGADTGSQYRSIILTTSEPQRVAVGTYLERLRHATTFKRPIVTEVRPLDHFYPAEISHQEYYRRNPHAAYCQLVIDPKLAKLKARFNSLLQGGV